ncbi:MAG: S8 family peptidase [Actinomycetota bacterium]
MTRKARFLALALIAALTTLWPSGAGAATERHSYIVMLKRSVEKPAAVGHRQAQRFGTDLDLVYRHAVEGFALDLTAAQARVLTANPNVVSVERDRVMRIQTTQTGATWGLDRIDQRNLPLDGNFTYNHTGAGVNAYIIDTGILFGHSEFGGRAVSGFDSVDGGSADDCNGHGTHVAGTVGGSTYGVAKSPRLVAVRVLNCAGSGSTSGVIAGIDWVTGDHQAGEPAVANMSLGGGASAALDNAVRNSIADGVSYAVAAGNGDIFGFEDDACFYSPARVGEAMTISATDSSDRKASWANYGSCVDWFAPGVSITSAWYTSPTATNTISGTSMATPHTAGVAALYLQGNPGASPGTVRQALFDLTTKNIVTGSSTSNAHLLFTNL